MNVQIMLIFLFWIATLPSGSSFTSPCLNNVCTNICTARATPRIRTDLQQRVKVSILPHRISAVSLFATVKRDGNAISSDALVTNEYDLVPLLNFRDSNDTINYIDRLDDAIMGGISTSTVRQTPSTQYAIWNGVCRTDGGGFCGFRTNPFNTPFMVKTNDANGGFYIKCRLVSDNEPDRRVWKISTRTKPDRGELLYQAPFDLPKRKNTAVGFYDDHRDADDIEWQTIYVPFETFRLVRGPQLVENGPPLNVSGGIYQLGMTMSRFVFAASSANGTRVEKTLPNFRDGFFELHIEEMGVYTPGQSSVTSIEKQDEGSIDTKLQQRILPLDVLTKVEVKQKRPILVKALFIVAKIFFSEQSQRRKSTMRILQEKYNMTRFKAIVWGFHRRLTISTIQHERQGVLQKYGRTVSSLFTTVSILCIDILRATLSLPLKILLFYPLRVLAKIAAMIKPKNKATTMSVDTAS
jgi:Complex I intermediate-associated protein 30 (CIA30)